MIVVVGYLTVAPAQRDRFLELSMGAVAAARTRPGCVDFAVSADPIDDERVNVHEVWASRDALDAFRGAGPSAPLDDLIVAAAVSEYEVADDGG